VIQGESGFGSGSIWHHTDAGSIVDLSPPAAACPRGGTTTQHHRQPVPEQGQAVSPQVVGSPR
jgi:hypothetical protein